MVLIRTRWQRRNGIQAWSCWWFLAQIFSWSTLIDSSYLSVKISRVGKKVEAGFLRQVPYWLTYVACYTSPTAMEAAQSSPKSIDLRILSSTETSIDWWQGPKIVKGSVRSGRRRRRGNVLNKLLHLELLKGALRTKSPLELWPLITWNVCTVVATAKMVKIMFGSRQDSKPDRSKIKYSHQIRYYRKTSTTWCLWMLSLKCLWQS